MCAVHFRGRHLVNLQLLCDIITILRTSLQLYELPYLTEPPVACQNYVTYVRSLSPISSMMKSFEPDVQRPPQRTTPSN